MKNILSILAITTAVTLITSSSTPAHAGFNWNDVWGAIKKGGVQQPTPETSAPSLNNDSNMGGNLYPTAQDNTSSSEIPSILNSGAADNENVDSISIE
jgi:hypothetical protein